MKEEYVEECQSILVHNDLVQNVLETMPDENIIFDLTDEDTLYRLAELFKVFGDSTRIKIMYCILKNELCVCDIATAINMTHSAVSHQLKNLKQAKLVKARKDGKEVYYSLNDEHVEKIFNQALEHIEERGKYGRE